MSSLSLSLSLSSPSTCLSPSPFIPNGQPEWKWIGGQFLFSSAPNPPCLNLVGFRKVKGDKYLFILQSQLAFGIRLLPSKTTARSARLKQQFGSCAMLGTRKSTEPWVLNGGLAKSTTPIPNVAFFWEINKHMWTR